MPHTTGACRAALPPSVSPRRAYDTSGLSSACVGLGGAPLTLTGRATDDGPATPRSADDGGPPRNTDEGGPENTGLSLASEGDTEGTPGGGGPSETSMRGSGPGRKRG